MKTILLLFSAILSLLRASSLDLRCEASAFGLKSYSGPTLSVHIGNLYLTGGQEQLWRLLKAKYFDYDPYLVSFCSSLRSRNVLIRLVKDLASEFPSLAADCLCVSSKNYHDLPWDVVNPLQSKYFRAHYWSEHSYKRLLLHTKVNETDNANIRWDQTFKGISEAETDGYLSLKDWNVPPARLWSTISFYSIHGVALHVKNRIFEIAATMKSSEGGELIARLLLIGYLYRKTSVIGTYESLRFIEETASDALITSLCACIRSGGHMGPCKDFTFIEQLFNALKSQFSEIFAPYVNLFFHVAVWSLSEVDWRWQVRKFGAFLYDVDRSNWPTISETCAILSLRPSTLLLTKFIYNRPDYLARVVYECPKLIPRQYLSLETRAELFLTTSRSAPAEIGDFSLRFAFDHSKPLSALLMVCNQLEALYRLHHRRLLQMHVNASFFSLEPQVYSFTLLIRAFFSLFLLQNDWYIFDTQQQLIPSSQCPPQVLFTFGFLVGAAVIFQKSLPLKLSFEYFMLIESESSSPIASFYRKSFPEAGSLPFKIYPFMEASLAIITSVLTDPEAKIVEMSPSKQINIFSLGIEKFWMGIEAACDLSLFSRSEFYNLIPQ